MFTLEVEVALFLYFRQQVIQVKFHMRCSKWQVEMLYEFSDRQYSETFFLTHEQAQ